MNDTMAEISFAAERWADVRSELAPLSCAHWQETEEAMYGAQDAIPVNETLLEALEHGGALLVVTLRIANALHGYAAYCSAPSLNMPGRTTAQALALYVSPLARKDKFAALRLLRTAENMLRQRGVWGLSYNSPASRPCDALYRRLGARMTETVWYKEL